MSEYLEGCLYLIKLNETSFSINPGRVELPKGKYIIEIRDGSFCYDSSYTVDVGVSFIEDGNKKQVIFPDLGVYDNSESAINTYQGMVMEINHDGGIVDIYNHKSAMLYNGKCSGNCVVAIWDGKHFGSSISQDNFINIGYQPVSDRKVLILTSKPDSKPYDKLLNDMELSWQSDLNNIEQYNAIIASSESFSFLYMIRDTNAFSKYLANGGRIYLVGSALYYLSYDKNVPQNLPDYIGDAQYMSVDANPGDMIKKNNDNGYMLRFGQSITVPVLSIDKEDKSQLIQNVNDKSAPTWSTSRRFSPNKGKIVWSSFFLMNYSYTEKWNIFICEQLEWLLK